MDSDHSDGLGKLVLFCEVGELALVTDDQKEANIKKIRFNQAGSV